MDENPYQTPRADLSSKNSATPSTISTRVLQELGGTRPWVLFLAILGLIWVTLLLIAAFAMAMAGLSFGMFFLIAGFYIMIAIIFSVPCLILWRYGRAIARLQQAPDEKKLLNTLLLHRRFWKSFGISCIVTIVLTATGTIILPMLFFSDLAQPESEATFDSAFPEDMDLSELEEL